MQSAFHNHRLWLKLAMPFAVGEKVQYWCDTHSRWVDGTVRTVHDNGGLDIVGVDGEVVEDPLRVESLAPRVAPLEFAIC